MPTSRTALRSAPHTRAHEIVSVDKKAGTLVLCSLHLVTPCAVRRAAPAGEATAPAGWGYGTAHRCRTALAVIAALRALMLAVRMGSPSILRFVSIPSPLPAVPRLWAHTIWGTVPRPPGLMAHVIEGAVPHQSTAQAAPHAVVGPCRPRHQCGCAHALAVRNARLCIGSLQAARQYSAEAPSARKVSATSSYC